MNRNEKKLFIELCSFRDPSYSKIERLLSKGAATYAVLGMLFENRVAAVAFEVLKRIDLLEKTDREFRNSIRNASMLNEKWNEDFEVCLDFVSKILNTCAVPYALVKGAYLFGQYPLDGRVSNDIDVLVAPEHVGVLSKSLRAAGFRQGYIKNGVFIPATRQQIVESQMTRGETVPFIIEIGLSFIQYLEVDINFSLDYKSEEGCELKEMLSRTKYVSVRNIMISTLDKYDFMVHLCSHLYKEATTMPWIQMKRDMTFYKYCDVYALLYDYSNKDVRVLIERVRHYGLERELLYCLKSIYFFFKLRQPMFRKYLVQSDVFLEGVISPEEKKQYRYTETNPARRFFKKDRLLLLEEVVS